ncbi:MAG: SDR family oxidoreductase [Candidatus Hydrogenedentes bacterium]|nr:SDR family oxidoreductase [Candidatus Hydrogenedentota bacterium]
MTTRSIFITGATGILGSWVLAKALQRGYSPIVLTRDENEAKARLRLKAVLAIAGMPEDAADKVEILLGDTAEPNFGLSDAQRQYIRDTAEFVIHSAACISFSPRKSATLKAANVDSVVSMIELLDGTGIPLYHVSTAYVAGNHQGLALESGLLDTPCKTTYEQTKREAESLIDEAMASGRVKGATFRPAIIVGASTDGSISQFFNFYSILRMVDVLEHGKIEGSRKLRLQGNPSSTLNLVTVDWVSEALWRILESEGASGQTYHLTNPAPCAQQELTDWATSHLAPKGGALGFTNVLKGEITLAEKVANASLMLYRAYLQSEPLYDRTNTDRVLGSALPCPRITGELLTKMLEFARAQDWEGAFGCKLQGLLLDEAPGSQIDISRLMRDIVEEPLAV